MSSAVSTKLLLQTYGFINGAQILTYFHVGIYGYNSIGSLILNLNTKHYMLHIAVGPVLVSSTFFCF